MINDDLNTLIVQYIAKTGQLPIISEKELLEIPKLKFGQHINRITGFVKSGGDSASSSQASSSTFGIKKPKPVSNNADSSDADSSDDELAINSWKENFMRHFNTDITEHEQTYRKLTETIAHYRRVWKAIQSVIEKKILSTIDEYNRLESYEMSEKRRCENKNCHYIPFTAYRKSIHKRFTTYFDEFPPFSLQRVCELLTLTSDIRERRRLNCGKLMRSLDKNLRVVTYWKPVDIDALFEDLGKDTVSECGDKTDDEDRGSIFNDTASIHSISKHSWASKSMMSPRSCGSQSPFHPTNFDDPELSIIRDIGPGASVECMNRVPSPITTQNQLVQNINKDLGTDQLTFDGQKTNVVTTSSTVQVPQVKLSRTLSEEDKTPNASEVAGIADSAKRRSLDQDIITDSTNPPSSPKKPKHDLDDNTAEPEQDNAAKDTNNDNDDPMKTDTPPEDDTQKSTPTEKELDEAARQIVESTMESTHMDTGDFSERVEPPPSSPTEEIETKKDVNDENSMQ